MKIKTKKIDLVIFIQHLRLLLFKILGESIGTWCMYENEITDEDNIMCTQAEYYDQTNEWILNGTKAFVFNPKIANLYIVFAQTVSKNMLGDMDNTISAFIVDANTPGVTIIEDGSTVGHCEVQRGFVKFDKVHVPSENVLFKIGYGQKIGKKLLIDTRLQLATLCVAQMKNLLETVIDHSEKDEKRLADQA